MLQHSPNPKGVLGSKASGEPSLLLTTSILYALRDAVESARSTLPPALASKPQPSAGTAPVREHLKPLDESSVVYEGHGHGKTAEDFFVLAAPATTVRLKQACGGFSVAEVLKDAIGGRHSQASRASSSGSESWVEVKGALRDDRLSGMSA